MSTPFVSIGIPVYNGEAFLARALDTLLAQTVDDFEIVISDNGSTDSSPAMLREYEAADKRIRVEYHDQNRGAAWNYNRVLEIANPKAKYFKWVACDDEHDPTYLAATTELMEADPGLSLTHSRTRDIDEHNNELKVWDDEVMGLDSESPATRIHDLVTTNYECFQAFGLIRSDVAHQTQGLGRFSDADRVLIVEIALRGRMQNSPEVLFSRRQHSQRSMVVYASARERHAWFDPKLADKIALPYWRLGLEFSRAIRRAPLSAAERRECLAELGSFAVAHRSYLARNVARAGITLASRTAERTGLAGDRTEPKAPSH
jgi:glycosyltransferase involved in cell wall biosynthesis